MNLLLVLVGLVVFIYFGGKYVPKMLKDNKQILLGCLVGVLLHRFMGIGIEGIDGSGPPDSGGAHCDVGLGRTDSFGVGAGASCTLDTSSGTQGKGATPQNNVLRCSDTNITYICPDDSMSFTAKAS